MLLVSGGVAWLEGASFSLKHGTVKGLELSTDLCQYVGFYAPVAQLDRVSGFEPGGREFESLRARAGS